MRETIFPFNERLKECVLQRVPLIYTQCIVQVTGKMDGYTGTESTQWTYTTNMVLYVQRYPSISFKGTCFN